MAAVHADLAAETASFTSAFSDADLVCRREIVGTGSFKTKVSAVYRRNSDVLFVGAITTETATAIMPSHQANDLIVVFAVNGSGTTIPTAPVGAGWETQADSDSILGYHLAYKFAKTNSETVGPWVGSTRTTAVVYRNVRKIGATVASSKDFLATSIDYPAISLDSSGGTRVVYFGVTEQNLDSALTPTGTTTRTSTDAIGGSAPGSAVHDELQPNGTVDVSSISESVASTESQAISLELLSGVPEMEAVKAEYTTSLHGDVFKNRLSPVSRRYSVTLPQVFWLYKRFYSGDSVTFTTSYSDVSTPRGYYLDIETSVFSLADSDETLTRSLICKPLSRSFAFTEGLIGFAKGFFTSIDSASFSATFHATTLELIALLQALSSRFDANSGNTLFKRVLLKDAAAAIFLSTASQVGFRNDTPYPPSGGPFSPAVPFHLQPTIVKYNSVGKSRDLGIVNNFYGVFSGFVGSEVGTPTAFFKIRLLGKADLRILIKPISKFTDKYISVGIADSNRKSVKVNDFGFAYQSEAVNTERLEFFEPMPAGSYYFTISTSQWQKIPYSVEIQAIRFTALSGLVLLTGQSEARFAISKLIGPAVLTGPLQAIIPTNDQLKQPSGPVLLTSGSRGALTTPSGIATMRMLPTGRLKLTHKIGGAASMAGANVATLSSAPPSNGGYGP